MTLVFVVSLALGMFSAAADGAVGTGLLRGAAPLYAGASIATPSGPGNLTPLTLASIPTLSEPVWIIVSPDGKNAYVGYEHEDLIGQFTRNTSTGELTAMSPATVQSGGSEPRTLTVSPDGKYLYAANFASNNITTFSRNSSTGALTVSGSTVPTGSEPHGIEITADGKSVYAANFADNSISQYSRNSETGVLTALNPATVPAGTNPNGIVISVDGGSVYTANRGSDSVSQYSRNAETGKLTPLSPATVEAGELPHDVAISPDGRSVYVPDSGESRVSQYSRNTETGRLSALSPATVATAGEARGAAVSSDGANVYVALGSNELVGQFSREATGALTPLSPPSVVAGKHSYSVALSPDGQSAYVTNETGNSISQYSRATLASPPTVVTGAATTLGQTSATLNATVNPNGNQVSECTLEYGTSTTYGKTTTCSPFPESGWNAVPVSGSAVNLTAGTTYHYRAVATNSNGRGAGADRTFATLPNPPIATTGVASAVGQATAKLNASVNPNGGEVSECKLEYGTSSSYGSSAPCVPSPGSGSVGVDVSAQVTALNANTSYHFRVVAKNSGGTSAGSDATLKTLPSPPVVVTEAASGVRQTSATLNATVNPNGGQVSECTLEYGTTSSYGLSTACTLSPGSGSTAVGVSALAVELSANTTYHFRVVATNTGGSSAGKDQRFTTLPSPPAVVTESASEVGQTSARLSATVNPNGGEVSECELEYGTSSSYGSSATCTPSSPGSGTSAVTVSASVAGLSANTTYHFRVVAKNAGGTSIGSDQHFTTAPLPQAAAPPQEVPPPVATVPPVPDVKLVSTSIVVSASGVAIVKVTCPAGGSACTGTLMLRTLNAVNAIAASQVVKPKAIILTLGSISFNVPAGQVRTLRLRLSARARNLLSRTRVLKVRATFVAHDAGGAAHTNQIKITLRAPKIIVRKA